MIFLGKVINVLPTEKPIRAVVLLDEWPFSIEVPMGTLTKGARVEIKINQLRVLGASAGSPHPKLMST